MLIETPGCANVFGSVKIYDVQKVLKLESNKFKTPLLCGISREQIDCILDKLSIIIPIRNEKIRLLDGILRAIPRNCLIIIVSNSSRTRRDIFKMEEDTINNFHNVTKHPVLFIHQKDPGLASAFKEAGYTYILDEDGLVFDGKAEGMLTGLLISKFLEKDFVGFIDADNYIPGAVNEYIRDFAAGFYMSESPYTMIRLHWKYKPKIVKSKLYFRKWGRVSMVTNRYLNQLLANYAGFETEIIKTANAGEHAMTMKLAEIMNYSTGYSIEPYQLIYLLEELGYGDSKYTDAINAGIELFQIETLNPHLHEEKGEKHINDMLLNSLSTIYYSKLCNEYLKSEILEELRISNVLGLGDVLKKNQIIPSIGEIDIKKFMRVLEKYSETFARFE